VHTSAEEEADLFWAMRGAGHNFGTVIGLELDLIELEHVTFGLVWFAPEAIAEGLAWCREHLRDAPDELTTIVSIAHPPPSAPVPRESRGRPALHVIACHCGTREQARRDLAPLRDHPAVVADTIAEVPWAELAIGNDVFAAGVHRRSRMRYLRRLTDRVIAVSASHAPQMSPLSFMSTHIYGGAMSRVGEHDTAMSHRDQHLNYMVTASWTAGENGTALRAWQDRYLNALQPDATDAYYVNYLFDEPEHGPAAYAPATWERLGGIKRLWDPDNVFATNHNIPPAPAPAGYDGSGGSSRFSA
jgi:FAD/FMN-containing dehydrogenase